MSSSASARSRLLASAQALCNAFASHASVDELLSHFSNTHSITAIEHGEPFLAPFIREFTGRNGPMSVPAYFSLLQKHIKYENMTFGDWVVDAEARKVSTRGTATFTWIEGPGEGQSWDEYFVYMLDFDDEGKVTDYQVWADSGAAYLAGRGELSAKQKEYEAS
ncbi:hypothetical protein DAEQUDRAFT_770162 [Daedalea quercina L-15889]|uniref:SnoaL-like domain-containing protein n=1 Tax=Daedalea quercina L-15889 TaxID=1314783 RepID=A0A165L3T5_9APHY|nr:hypothetical protein DAEQUDRAFT_770162 [Daedalea quercina L-15889]